MKFEPSQKINPWVAWAFIVVSCVAVAMSLIFATKKVYQPVDDQILVAGTPERIVRIAAIGDIVCDQAVVKSDKHCQADAVAKAIKKRGPEGLLMLGDLQYEKGELAKFKSLFDPIFKDFKTITYPSPGNHEYNTKGAAGYYEYFAERLALLSPNEKRFFRVDLSGWQVYSLNSNCDFVGGCGPASPQYQWLKNQLQSNPARCSLAFWHHPLFSSSDVHGNDPRMQEIYELLQQSHVDVILNGHDHLYERFVRQNSVGQIDQNGPMQFIVGSGGKSLYNLKFTRQSGSAFAYNENFGFLELALKKTGFTWNFFTTDGQLLDQGSDRCSI
ncbi:MAG: metallophosphoesterase [Patescibacteria group bacterium]